MVPRKAFFGQLILILTLSSNIFLIFYIGTSHICFFRFLRKYCNQLTTCIAIRSWNNLVFFVILMISS
jgi:hypothetical protein